VWRVKYPKPSLKGRFKWNAICLLLTLVPYGNAITASKKKQAFTEALGRTVGWWSLVFNRPKVNGQFWHLLNLVIYLRVFNRRSFFLATTLFEGYNFQIQILQALSK
jgi:hypothetical protein